MENGGITITFKEEKQFQAAYTKYSQLENAEYINKIEKMYPEETKAITKQHEQSQELEPVAHTIPLNMKPNRDGYSSIEDVKSRLQTYEARRQEKLAAIDQAPAQESIQSILNKEKAQEAIQAPQMAQQVSQPIQAVETAQNAPKADPNHLRGIVVDYGSAPYLHNEKNNESYFVVVNENGTERTKWGVDIGPALDKADVKVGDFIDLQKTETVPAQATTKQGEKISTHRNSWEAEVIEPAQKQELAQQQAQKAPEATQDSYEQMMNSLGQKTRDKQAQKAEQSAKVEPQPRTETEEQRRARMLAEIEANKPIASYVDDFERMKKMAQAKSQSQARAVSVF